MTAKKKRAMPAAYNEELATGRSLKSVCSDPGMPAASAVYTWMNRHPEFKEMYARAKTADIATLFVQVPGIRVCVLWSPASASGKGAVQSVRFQTP